MFAAHSDASVKPSPIGLGRCATSPAAAHHAAATVAPTWMANMLAPGSTLVQAERDGEIIAQGAAVDCCYQVISGCVRTVMLLEDGRRQIGEFLFPGDLVGWDAAGEHGFGAEAVTPATLCRIPLRAIDERAARDQSFARELHHYMAAQLRGARARLVLLGRKTAGERVASFILEMQERLDLPRHEAIDLPMSRADIADYLGLTIETVCRGLTELRRGGLIGIDRTRILIHDGHALGRAGSEHLH
ncbi:MAG: helix-turn-helix domain-containing protein [Rhodospirillales bacterium]|nr:helix-turn-helix domain-containing protein [Rhodospirillales bacterium]MDE2573730.1 helix-turn-helix domain-containing protein [Rhodospirillales bacterium]